MFQPRTTAVLGSYVHADINGVQTVLRDHWVLIEGAVSPLARSRTATSHFYTAGHWPASPTTRRHNDGFRRRAADNAASDGAPDMPHFSDGRSQPGGEGHHDPRRSFADSPVEEGGFELSVPS